MEYMDWGMVLIDLVTAATGLWYWTMRRKFPGLVTGAAVYEDLRIRQRRALDIHDSVVQGLARAKLALDVQSDAEGGKAVEETLAASRQIITELLGNETIKPGDLRRGGKREGDVHG
jgi:hypothetical protein